MDCTADIASVRQIEFFHQGLSHRMGAVLIFDIVLPVAATPTKNGAHDHHSAGISAARAFASDTATRGEAAAGFENSVIPYAQSILDCSDGTLAAAGDGFFICNAQFHGTLN
jgi:hypothetical protein